jgi:hypothetical protein
MFPGCWTQEEIDAIKAKAEKRWQDMQKWVE